MRATTPLLTSQTVEVGGVGVHVVDQGVGPALVMVHGSPISSWSFRHLIGPLSKRFRVIAPDLLGFGRTPAPSGGAAFMAQARMLTQLLDALAIGPYRMVVHDWGGPIGVAAAAAGHDPLVQLVLMNTTLLGDFRPPPYWRPFVGDRFGGLLVERLNLVRWALPLLMRSARRRSVWRRYAQRLQRASTRRTVLSLERLEGFAALMAETHAQHHRLQVPTLVLWGTPDPYFRAAEVPRLMALFQDVTLAYVHGGGHFPQEDAPDDVLAALQRFLADDR